MVAGHSVGELTAAAVAGASRRDAVALAARRGADMAAACATTPTGMSAVLGGDPEVSSPPSRPPVWYPANQNGAGQIVAAGELDKFAALAAEPARRRTGTSARVAGAFHTHFMAPAEQALADFMAGLDVHDPAATLLSNADGRPSPSGADLVARLVRQMTLPVRWDLCLTWPTSASPPR